MRSSYKPLQSGSFRALPYYYAFYAMRLFPRGVYCPDPFVNPFLLYEPSREYYDSALPFSRLCPSHSFSSMYRGNTCIFSFPMPSPCSFLRYARLDMYASAPLSPMRQMHWQGPRRCRQGSLSSTPCPISHACRV